jgi:hypothetical protein
MPPALSINCNEREAAMIYQHPFGPVLDVTLRAVLIPAAILLMLTGMFMQPDPQPLCIPDPTIIPRDIS